MNKYRISPCSALRGTLVVPPDKSISHRVALVAALAEGESVISNMLLGEDNLATLKALKNLGVGIDVAGDQVHIQARGLNALQEAHQALDLENSGTSMRLLTGILAAQPFNSMLIGDASLSRRPMQRIVEPLVAMGADIEMSLGQTSPLLIKGNSDLKAIEYELPIASAQLKSCLLLAGLYAEGETVLHEIQPSRDHTELFLQHLNYPCVINQGSIRLKGRASIPSFHYTVPGDISSAAFFIVAACLIPGSELQLKNVGLNPRRIGILNALKKMGAELQFTVTHHEYGEPVGNIDVCYAPLKAVELGSEWVASCIDEYPILFVAATCATGVSTFDGVEELRVKESDRITVMLNALNAMGISTQHTASKVEIVGGVLQGGVSLDCADDHRVVMALSVAASCAKAETVLMNCAKVAGSYPGFMRDAHELGLRIKQ